MFPSLFKRLNSENLHHDICELAKHKLVTVPINNTRSSTYFALIHNDIWETIHI